MFEDKARIKTLFSAVIDSLPNFSEEMMKTKLFFSAIINALPDFPEQTMQDWIDNPKSLQDILRVALSQRAVSDPPKREQIPSIIVNIDRSDKLVYPDFVTRVCHPELEAIGPKEYDLTKLELYRSDDQKIHDGIKGDIIYQHLKETGIIETCLGLHDALEIQRQGIDVFRELFNSECIFFWKSIVERKKTLRQQTGDLDIPYLHDREGKVTLSWFWSGRGWKWFYPAARFPREQENLPINQSER